jgi:4-hydroxy-3-methylbut-2-enyl diphosphate reductase
MEEEGIGYSMSGLVAQMKEKNFVHVEGDVTVKLADSYGFCWGVERAVQMCYEARKQYPTEKMWITNEIIHNPTVNMRLSEMGVNFIEEKDGVKNFGPVQSGEVVVLPAFGASIHEMKLLAEKGVSIVDTTCPWVSKVWNAVGRHAGKVFTSIIHGKYAHEETVATASFAKTYLVVKDMKEASWVCDYILNGTATKAEFLEKFKNAHSDGFDPEKDLNAVGIANQTTMLKGETEAIGKLFERTMMEKHGVQNLGEHYLVTDTICDATQERQDAIYKLVDEKPDIMMIVGGFNSSNTSHLQEISEDANITSFWVDTADRIDTENNKIAWRTSYGEMRETENWLPEGKLTIGITSGASTPDKVVEDVLEAIFMSKAKTAAGSAR